MTDVIVITIITIIVTVNDSIIWGHVYDRHHCYYHYHYHSHC